MICPKCKTSDIPEIAKFCPKCGASLGGSQPVKKKSSKSFLFGGTGIPSSIQGFLTVDIRQCRRTKGLGWDGVYDFSPGLPIGYTGFYAVCNNSVYIQFLVENGKLSAIFLMDEEGYMLKLWMGQKKELYKEWVEGWFTSDYVTKCRYKMVKYFCYFKNDIFIDSNDDKNFEIAEAGIQCVLWEWEEIYSKEILNFLGVTWD